MAKILIIDDDPLVSETTKVILGTQGHEIVIANNGKSGIEAARASTFDIAIVDLFMPDIDGLEVIKTIRQSHPHMAMIAASGFMFGGECPQMPEFESIAAEAGAITTLYKPFRPQALWQAIAKATEGIAAA
jgi:CheY-like chemotaxis protein